MPYFDMHCHLDFASNALDAACELDERGAGAFAVGVLPGGLPAKTQDASAVSAKEGSLVRWGSGLHPWWVADGRAGAAQLDAMLEAVECDIYIGEVGLDFGKAHGGSRDEQLNAFQAIAGACAQKGGRVLSVHAVQAAENVLDILEESGALESCTCIFHWYSGSSNALCRALAAGCYFSVGQLMLRSRRGREYARQIPLSRLLLETDEPPEGGKYEVERMQGQLADTAAAIAQLRGEEPGALASVVEESSRLLLSL